ncbi:uncharacterized protein BDR25DRAFT_122299 [Lindgomyces ingoldianus]|uniref:Uncharacterized protein n=1 Tax=Lindgomyces ingoldianus TaxID=673940 RepID=A0ACB6Q7J2_9PLEO|nr:uncharacterized protein BDR25DRAFT_122299 [Lindgomyces ingoldianus]KAF2462828.1 hypothetical protein BDR25DRAFT_122299 [Lindgomyces ingoldianus]
MLTPLAADSITPALQTFSILAAAIAAGTNLSSSIVTLPALLHSAPSTLATQWQILYDYGITPVVSLSMSSAVGFATLAYRTTLTSTGAVTNARRNLYIAAAVATFGLAPYTKIVMNRTNEELMKRAKMSSSEGKSDTHDLVRQWGRLVLGRGTLLLIGAGLGLWASVN